MEGGDDEMKRGGDNSKLRAAGPCPFADMKSLDNESYIAAVLTTMYFINLAVNSTILKVLRSHHEFHCVKTKAISIGL